MLGFATFKGEAAYYCFKASASLSKGGGLAPLSKGHEMVFLATRVAYATPPPRSRPMR
jgi:hypothetical protein